jgi:molybdate transport system ATP-binding protein
MSIDVAIRHGFQAFTLDAGFKIDRPGITALFGQSGAGKTTIANAVAGLLRPNEGRIVIGETIAFDKAGGIFVPPRLRRIGYVFQDARLFPHLSVEQNLRFGSRRAPEPASSEEFARILSMLGLDQLLARKPAKLSGGEKGRVALGRALLSSPKLLLLDEPLAALDDARKAEILPYFEKLRDDAQIPMIYVTHSLDEVTRLANDIVLLKAGRVVAHGSVFDLLPDLEFAGLAEAPAIGAVFETSVVSQRSEDRLTVLRFGGGELLVPQVAQSVGTRLRVRLHAEDVIIARQRPLEISANNVLAATVTSIKANDGRADIQLRCGGVKIVARITQASLVRLGLVPGTPVFAIVKSAIVDLR